MADRGRADSQRIAKVVLDDPARVRLSAQVEHERRAALFALTEENAFAPVGDFEGPYDVHLRVDGTRLTFDIRDEADAPLTRFSLPLTEIRRIVKDYFLICDSYYKSIRTASPSRIEAIDMGRRGLHNEGAELLRDALRDKVSMDAETARRLFTLVCVLHIRA